MLLPVNYSHEQAMSSPQGSFVIVPDDTYDLTVSGGAPTAANPRVLVKGLFLTVAGNVKMTFENGMVDTLALPAGGNKLRVRQVWSTGTTATGLHGFV